MKSQRTSGGFAVPEHLKPYISLIVAQIGADPEHPPVNLTLDQAAKALDLSKHTLNVWRSNGRYNLKFVKIGRSVRYPLLTTAEFLYSREFTHTGQIGGASQ